MTNPLARGFDRLLTLKRSDRKDFVQKPSSRASGFSAEAMQGLADLDARSAPLEAITQASSGSNFRRTRRLSNDAAAGGGLVTDDRGNQVPHYWGHRKRLRERFLLGGHMPMPEYEVLELLLFNAIKRIDVKPLAKRLLAEFGDLNGVIAATEHRLLKVFGATPKVYLQLRIAEAFAQRTGQAKVLKREVWYAFNASDESHTNLQEDRQFACCSAFAESHQDGQYSAISWR